MFKRYIPAFFWACIILVFCGYPGSGLPHVSFHFILPLDKYVHIFLFGTLCFLLQAAFKKRASLTFVNGHPIFYAFLTTIFYGVLIEFLQKYVFIGRSFEWMDVVADASGAFLVVLYYWLRSQRFFLFEDSLNELVFEDRNKRYGAYFLRMRYSGQVLKAFFIAVVLVVLIFGLPFLACLFEVEAALEEVVEVNTIQLLVPPGFDKTALEIEVPVPTREVSKPKIVKDLPKTIPVSLEATVVPNPNAKLAELFEKTKSDAPAPPIDSLAVVQEKVVPDKERLKVLIEALPSFPGGQEAFRDFLKKNMAYPGLAKKSGIAGIVLISFIVEDNGKSDQIKVLRGLPGGCNEEALRVLALMPAWKPGKRHGLPIPFMMVLPVEFALR
jgi:protein TonB